jgi:hypothetical protein
MFDGLKQKLGLVDAARTSLPSGVGAGDLGHAFDTLLSDDNIRQLAFLDDFQQLIVSAWMAYNDCENEDDVELFSQLMVNNLLHTSVSVAGYRSEALQNIAVGQYTRDFQLELANIKARGREGELSDVI